MKISTISMAVAAACGSLMAGSAFALPASAYNNTSEFVGDTFNIRISGASAQDNGVLGSALSYCNPGTMHRFQISNNFVFFCTPDQGAGAGQIPLPVTSPAKTELAIYKYSVGGSGSGVAPVNNNAQLPFLDLAKIATSPACSGTNLTTSIVDFDGTGPLATYVNNVCGGASSLLTTPATTYIGLSDMEPAFFTNTVNNLFAEPATALIFGVPVTTNIRNALQTAQGLTSGSDTLANMPTLTSAQITSAFTQAGTTWTKVLGFTPAGLSDDTIYVARRVDSSGTQKTFEALVAKTANGETAFKSCATGVDVFVAPDNPAGLTTGDASSLCNNTTASGAAPLVFGGSGGGDVSACMNFHNAQTRGAIGMQTGETKPGALGWRFVKVDGNAPIHADAAAGKYLHVTQTSINTRINVNPTASALGYSAFVTRLKSDLKNPTIIKLINGTDQTFGPSGLMAIMPTGGTADLTGASAVYPWNRLVGGTVVNNCQPIKADF